MVSVSHYRCWKFNRWLENEQPKQERHSMQCGGGIQWLFETSVGLFPSPLIHGSGNKFIRSFCILFKDYYYCY
ncbi:unnamed protein product [Laminaria digitata]